MTADQNATDNATLLGRKFRVIRADETPPQALTWATSRERDHVLWCWRRGVTAGFPQKARVIRLAWALEWFFRKAGFAYAGDRYLAEQAGIALNKLQEVLTRLERSGAIIRVHVYENSAPKRRIYPAATIAVPLLPKLGGAGYPPTRN